MRRSRSAIPWMCLAAALFAGGCGRDSAGPGEPTPIDTVYYQSAHFQIVDRAATPEPLIIAFRDLLEREYERVRGFLPEFPAPDTITAFIDRGPGLAAVSQGLPRMYQYLTDGALQFDYVPHQLTHLWTRYAKRAFLEEGLAVYVTEQLVPDSRTVNPYRGQSPHAWVTLFDQHDSFISLFTAYRAGNFSFSATGSPSDAVAWQLFVEAGSFTRWVMDTYGRETWMQLYRSDDLGSSLGGSTPEFEQAWLAAARAIHPTPLACESALQPYGSREEFWCRRAKGQ